MRVNATPRPGWRRLRFFAGPSQGLPDSREQQRRRQFFPPLDPSETQWFQASHGIDRSAFSRSRWRFAPCQLGTAEFSPQRSQGFPDRPPPHVEWAIFPITIPCRAAWTWFVRRCNDDGDDLVWPAPLKTERRSRIPRLSPSSYSRPPELRV